MFSRYFIYIVTCQLDMHFEHSAKVVPNQQYLPKKYLFLITYITPNTTMFKATKV